MSTPEQQPNLTQTVQLLAEINKLSLKAIKSQSRQELIFQILNDSVVVVPYDRAVLWQLGDKYSSPKLLGVSGQPTVKSQTDLSRQWSQTVRKIEDPSKTQLLDIPQLPVTTSVLWMPIQVHDKARFGLWLERWNDVKWDKSSVDILSFLMQAYSAAWQKFYKRFSWRMLLGKPITAALVGLLLASFFIRIPLRVIAPCEVVPKDPVVITAPLEGIIEKINVTPGQDVAIGTQLFEYDKRVPLQELRVAQKKVEINQSEVDRSNALGLKDKKALAELAVNTLKLHKEQLELQLAQYHASQLAVKSPIAGVAMVDTPDEWHGKPVKIGEKIMVIADPHDTKVRMWVPEDDNVTLDLSKPIKIFLNVYPATSFQAKITYISSYTHVTEKQIPSFIAEAEWVGETEGVKLGLKGTAILYGDDVSVFYWVIRKPLAYVRRFLGI